MYSYTYTASKNTTVREETYEKLRAHNRSDESFCDVIDRLATAQTNPMDSAGAFSRLDEAYEEARQEFEDDVEERANGLSR